VAASGVHEFNLEQTMRILWVHNFSDRVVSAGVFMFSLAGELRRIGVDLDLYNTGSLRSFTNLLAARHKVARMSSQYDLVHAQFGSACALVTSRAKCPKVLSLRGTDLLGCDTGSWWYLMHGRAARWMTRRSLTHYDRVLVMSHRMRSELLQYHGRSLGVAVVPSGVDLQRFRPVDRMEARRKLGFPGDKRPWVLFATLRPHNPIKRPELASAAFEYAKSRRPDLVMHTLSGRLHDEVQLWMGAANVLLMTSTREGWPNVVKEALACNVPFVSTDVSDLAAIAGVEPSCTVAEADARALGAGILNAIDCATPVTLRRHVEPMALTKIAEHVRSIYEELVFSPNVAAAA
jgi:glycosyltransferase involved in cell wall biosynthesis